jgi:uncharacterized protein (TIGR02145 family)
LPLPAITLASGSTAQTVTAGDAITEIQYTTSNASGATATGLPDGVSGSWSSDVYTISGTPTSSGTFNYTVTTTNDKGCNNATANGTITVTLPPPITYTGCTTPTIVLGKVGFISSDTYSRYGLTISAPVTATYCNGRTYETFDGGSSGAFMADCATNYYGAELGNWFTWCMVKQYAEQLCPNQWRVPTLEDHCLIANGSTTNCNQLSSNLNGVDGYTYTGHARTGSYHRGGLSGYYWSSTETNSDFGYDLGFSSNGTFPQDSYGKERGFALRCVQDAP